MLGNSNHLNRQMKGIYIGQAECEILQLTEKDCVHWVYVPSSQLPKPISTPLPLESSLSPA